MVYYTVVYSTLFEMACPQNKHDLWVAIFFIYKHYTSILVYTLYVVQKYT